MAKRSSLAALGLAALAWSSVAHAKEEFPSLIQNKLGLTYEVPCSVCHLKENTASSTVRTAFALSLKARDFKDASSLDSALQRLKDDNFDSDGDGVSDVDELQAGTDPNSAANSSLKDELEPGYGCGGSAPHGRSAGQAFVGVAALGWLLTRRRRAR